MYRHVTLHILRNGEDAKGRRELRTVIVAFQKNGDAHRISIQADQTLVVSASERRVPLRVTSIKQNMVRYLRTRIIADKNPEKILRIKVQQHMQPLLQNPDSCVSPSTYC